MVKCENSRKYLTDVEAKNTMTGEDNAKKYLEIEVKRQDHHHLFRMALESLMSRLKEWEKEQERVHGIKGVEK